MHSKTYKFIFKCRKCGRYFGCNGFHETVNGISSNIECFNDDRKACACNDCQYSERCTAELITDKKLIVASVL